MVTRYTHLRTDGAWGYFDDQNDDGLGAAAILQKPDIRYTRYIEKCALYCPVSNQATNFELSIQVKKKTDFVTQNNFDVLINEQYKELQVDPLRCFPVERSLQFMD